MMLPTLSQISLYFYNNSFFLIWKDYWHCLWSFNFWKNETSYCHWISRTAWKSPWYHTRETLFLIRESTVRFLRAMYFCLDINILPPKIFFNGLGCCIFHYYIFNWSYNTESTIYTTDFFFLYSFIYFFMYSLIFACFIETYYSIFLLYSLSFCLSSSSIIQDGLLSALLLFCSSSDNYLYWSRPNFWSLSLLS